MSSSIGEILSDLEVFVDGIKVRMEESLVSFPTYEALSKKASSSLQKLTKMQQVLWKVSVLMTETQFKKMAVTDLLHELKVGGKFDFREVQPSIKELTFWKEKLICLEGLIRHRENTLIHAVTVIRSIQSAGTNRRLFEE